MMEQRAFVKTVIRIAELVQEINQTIVLRVVLQTTENWYQTCVFVKPVFSKTMLLFAVLVTQPVLLAMEPRIRIASLAVQLITEFNLVAHACVLQGTTKTVMESARLVTIHAKPAMAQIMIIVWVATPRVEIASLSTREFVRARADSTMMELILYAKLAIFLAWLVLLVIIRIVRVVLRVIIGN